MASKASAAALATMALLLVLAGCDLVGGEFQGARPEGGDTSSQSSGPAGTSSGPSSGSVGGASAGGAGGAGGAWECSGEADCSADEHCESGACIGDFVAGVACEGDEACVTGHCVDGVCCDAACEGECDVCSATLGASVDGSCTVVSPGEAGSPACVPYVCDGASPTCPSSCTADSRCALSLCSVGITDTCVGTCGSPDRKPSSVPSCLSGAAGAGSDCGPGSNASCCGSGLVPCGRYQRSYDNIGFKDASNPALVSDFRLDTYQITVGRFRAFVGAGKGTQQDPPAVGASAHPMIAGTGWDVSWNGSLVADSAALKAALKCDASYQTWSDSPAGSEKRPINCITWFEAFAFCAWDGARLPTEAEWNYAAAGGDEQREYPWGTGIDSSYAAYAPSASPVAVGSTSPKGDGKWGQSDLAGNLWEWTFDWYASPYANPCVDCANSAVATERVVRGGSFGSAASFVRVSFRNYSQPTIRNGYVGARCARDP